MNATVTGVVSEVAAEVEVSCVNALDLGNLVILLEKMWDGLKMTVSSYPPC